MKLSHSHNAKLVRKLALLAIEVAVLFLTGRNKKSRENCISLEEKFWNLKGERETKCWGRYPKGSREWKNHSGTYIIKQKFERNDEHFI